VLFIKSKIQFFESKSQLIEVLINNIFSCLSSQRYNFLKANHNILVFSWLIYMLFIKSKIQFFESKSQRASAAYYVACSCLSSQRYNFLKANHNVLIWVKNNRRLFIKSKIQFFESKSQQNNVWQITVLSCLSSQRYNFLKANHNIIDRLIGWCNVVYQVKDTIFWKQITTGKRSSAEPYSLFIKSKIQFFESKSQQIK